MNRRLFVGHLSAGLTLLPLAFTEAFPLPVGSDYLAAQRIEGATSLLRGGQIGTIQRLAVSRIYSPERVSVSVLRETAQQDFRLAGQLLGVNLAVDVPVIFQDPSSARFGTYSARFERAGLSIVWQSLARLNAPDTTPTGRMLLLGSQGLLQIDTQTHAYQTVDFRGRSLQFDN